MFLYGFAVVEKKRWLVKKADPLCEARVSVLELSRIRGRTCAERFATVSARTARHSLEETNLFLATMPREFQIVFVVLGSESLLW